MMISMHTKKDKKLEQTQMTSQYSSSWVREALEPDQLATAKKAHRIDRRHLSTGTVIILWALRLYVVLMMFIIAYQIWTAIQS
ncbi:MAG: hypothetical protein ABI406_18810 [Ktedonobacteraceae bacterium]